MSFKRALRDETKTPKLVPDSHIWAEIKGLQTKIYPISIIYKTMLIQIFFDIFDV